MPLIQKPQEPPQKEQIRIRLEKNLLAEMQAYCNWTGISLEHFLEQAALLVFDKDKDCVSKRNKPTWRANPQIIYDCGIKASLI
jgi:hypothetical protein